MLVGPSLLLCGSRPRMSPVVEYRNTFSCAAAGAAANAISAAEAINKPVRVMVWSPETSRVARPRPSRTVTHSRREGSPPAEVFKIGTGHDPSCAVRDARASSGRRGGVSSAGRPIERAPPPTGRSPFARPPLRATSRDRRAARCLRLPHALVVVASAPRPTPHADGNATMRLHPGSALKTAARRWARLLQANVAEVPPELDACESSCRRTDCGCAEWASCELRRRHEASRRAHAAETDEPS